METRAIKKKAEAPKRRGIEYEILIITLTTSAIPLLFFLVVTLILQSSTNILHNIPWIWSIAYGLIAVCIVSIIGYFTIRRITAPLKRLAEGIDLAGNGNLDHRIEIDTNDEFREIAEKFNKLTASLRGEIASLRETEERYSDLIDNLSAMIHQIDKDMRFISINRAELKLLGYSQEEMLKMRLTDLVPEEEKEKIVAHVERLKKRARARLIRYLLKRAGRRLL